MAKHNMLLEKAASSGLAHDNSPTKIKPKYAAGAGKCIVLFVGFLHAATFCFCKATVPTDLQQQIYAMLHRVCIIQCSARYYHKLRKSQAELTCCVTWHLLRTADSRLSCCRLSNIVHRP